MVRTDKYKLIMYPHIGKQQLFDIENDPEEMNDLNDDENYETVKRDLFDRFLNLQKEVGDTLKVFLN